MQRLTREQAAVIGAYTGILCGPVEDLHGYAQKVMNAHVFSHHFADPEFVEHLRVATKPDFLAICAEKGEG